MKQSIVFYKELTPAEVGKKGTHEVYIRLPNNFDHNAFFGNTAVMNGAVMEVNFIAIDKTNGGNKSISLRFAYFLNSNKEKRIPSLAPLFKSHDITEGDIVCLESRIGASSNTYYIRFYKKGEIQINPASIYFSHVENEDSEDSNICDKNLPLQVIYYGAPGTGKSHEIKEQTAGQSVIRTTFHPDSDYATFVGAYKPTTKEVPMRDVTGKVIIENGKPVTENRIVYRFVRQAFLKAYLAAWKKYADGAPQYLVIEEINRGNCAQIFGDLFQLLDRDDSGFSTYPIEADSDLRDEVAKAFGNDGDHTLAADFNVDDAVAGYTSNYGATLTDDIRQGRILLLPPNLYIWATMNTSDQSLFPIDSAFKRRWEWKYMKITEGTDENGNSLGWKIAGTAPDNNSGNIEWWDFIQKINKIIASMTSSADKQLGYFFCEAGSDKVISEETFVSKVLFYLWNDVFKDYGFEDSSLFRFKDKNGKEQDLTFPDFYDDSGKKVNTARLSDFVTKVMKWERSDDKGGE